MHYEHIIKNCFDNVLGSNGASLRAYDEVLAQIPKQIANIKKKNLRLLEVPYESEDIEQLKKTANRIKDQFSDVVILGTGGSTLNPQAIVALRPKCKMKTKIHFADNIDPFTMDSLLEGLDLKSTCFLAISKSGKTVETLAQVLVCLERLKQLGISNVGEYFIVISDPVASPLRKIAKHIGAEIIDHEAGVGGRFSTFTNVGLLPALIARLDPYALRSGAKDVIDGTFSKKENSPAAQGAALAKTFIDKGININVLMPYVDRLAKFNIWVQQIWAESLGKQESASTIVGAVGTLDQHSQLQLYLGGPRDKLFSVITLNNGGKGAEINTDFLHDKSIDYINGRTIGDVIDASQRATIDTLIKNQCPTREIKLQELNEETLGALMMHFSLETIITAEFMGINAFDQPAVEEGKILARKILGS